MSSPNQLNFVEVWLPLVTSKLQKRHRKRSGRYNIPKKSPRWGSSLLFVTSTDFFVSGFVKTAAPCSRKLKKREPSHFILDDQECKAVNELKNYLVSPPFLMLLRANGQYTIDTIAFGPRSDVFLFARARRWCIEANRILVVLTLQSGEKIWYSLQEMSGRRLVSSSVKPYLKCLNFKIQTNHHALRWILDRKESTRSLPEWRLRL